MNIQFFIPTGCTVPTDLRLKVDDMKDTVWRDAYEIMNDFLIRWFNSRKCHRKARWKRKYKRMWKSIEKSMLKEGEQE